MKNVVFLFLCTFYVLLISPSHADVLGPDASLIIEQQTLNGVTCNTYTLKDISGEVPLGDGKCFSRGELMVERLIESLQQFMAMQIAGSIIIIPSVILGALPGAAIGGVIGDLFFSSGTIAAIEAAETAMLVGMAAGTVAYMASTARWIYKKTSSINPVKQTKDFLSLSRKIIGDIDYEVPRNEIVTKLAETLDGVLQ